MLVLSVVLVLILLFKTHQSSINKSFIVGTWRCREKTHIFYQDYTYEDNINYHHSKLSFIYEVSETDSSISINCENKKDCLPSKFKMKYLSKSKDTIIWYSFWTETKDDTLIRVK